MTKTVINLKKRIEKIMDKMEGKNVEVRQMKGVRHSQYYERFGYYINENDEGFEVVLLDDDNIECDPMAFDVQDVGEDITQIECLEDNMMILHVGSVDLMLATCA